VALVQKMVGCEIVGVCDRQLSTAKQLYERFSVKGYFSNLDELVSKARPDVIHITTPPAGHFDVAKFCLEHGCHIYVEKPFTLDAEEAQQLVDLATAKGLKLTVGHNLQFSHVARRMRALVESGYLGGDPVHMESHYSYNLRDPKYARAVLDDKHHWVRSLPGGLLQNIISHGIARIAEFLSNDSLQVVAYGFVSPYLKSIGETGIVDELRAIICDGKQSTAYFTFSSQIRPSIHQFRVYGPKNGLMLDQDHEVLISLRGAKFKSYADNFIPPVLFAKQYLGNLSKNMRLFLRRDFHANSGMKYLIEAFYRSIRENAALPIPHREILLTARIMDAIFDQLKTAPPQDCWALRP